MFIPNRSQKSQGLFYMLGKCNRANCERERERGREIERQRERQKDSERYDRQGREIFTQNIHSSLCVVFSVLLPVMSIWKIEIGECSTHTISYSKVCCRAWVGDAAGGVITKGPCHLILQQGRLSGLGNPFVCMREGVQRFGILSLSQRVPSLNSKCYQHGQFILNNAIIQYLP